MPPWMMGGNGEQMQAAVMCAGGERGSMGRQGEREFRDPEFGIVRSIASLACAVCRAMDELA
jgi:hypothetical protein